jgi:hypothetical protein
MNKRINSTFSILILLIFLLSGNNARGQDAKTKTKTKPADDVTQNAKLWEQVNVPERDLYNGPGGQEMRPDLSKVTFLSVDTNGHNKKYRIKDAAGREWVAKLGHEARPETAAVRILWGIGYKTEINYLAPTITIPGKGTFENVRLEARPKHIKRLDQWSWRDNPFVGTNELQGLKIMMVFFLNWDLLDMQNKVLRVSNGDTVEHDYIISDLGATFGKVGNNNLPVIYRIGRETDKPEVWSKAGFIKDVKDGKLEFDFKGKSHDLMSNITVAQGRWLADLLMQLTDKQIEDTFRAANYSPAEIVTLKQAFKARVADLDKATRQAATASGQGEREK